MFEITILFLNVPFFHRRIEELEARLRESELNYRLAMDETNSKLHSKSSEANSAKLDNDKLRVRI